MVLFKDGLSVDQFKGSREMDRLKDFLHKHTGGSVSKTTSEGAAAEPEHTPNPSGEVIALTQSTFQQAIDSGPAFVKFYAPWCGHCKKLAPIWKNLAKHLQGKLTIAEVNCEDFKSLCQSQDVEGYPALMYYTGGSKTEYSGGRKLEQLKAFAEKATTS
jgi:thioredoxin domain-containing protein 5